MFARCIVVTSVFPLPNKMSRKKENRKSPEQRVPALPMSHESNASSSTDDRKILGRLDNLTRNREAFDAILTKHIFDQLKSGAAKDHIVEILLESGCPLDFALLMEDADVTRLILKRKTTISKEESWLLLELAMRSMYLQNIKVLVQYGPGAADRSAMFATRMFDMINGPQANLELASRFIKRLMDADVIDVYSMKFLEITFEVGQTEAVRMLLDCEVEEYARKKLGESLLVHLFGNENVDVVGLLRERRVDVNAKCGGMAALHFATFNNLDSNVRILLNSGADPNIRDCNGMTPLFAFGDKKCIELLLHNGADVQSIADNAYTILDMLFHPSLLGILLAHIALIEAQGATIKKEIRCKIISAPKFNNFYVKCCKQIERIGKSRIRDGFVLLRVLLGKPESIARFVNSRDMVNELISECRNLQIHSYYLATLERNINKAFAICSWRRKALKILLPIFVVVNFDEKIVGNIVDYLAFEDLLLFA